MLNICSFASSGVLDDDFLMSEDAAFGDERKYRISTAVNGYLAIINPEHGYKGYRTNPGGGGDVRLLFKTNKGVRFYTSLALEYFPLALPKNMVNFTEDIFTVQINLTANYLRWRKYIPYGGLGVGNYWHMLKQAIPNFGTKTDTQSYLGFNVHAGLEYRITPYVSISPQYKIHFIPQAGIYTTIASYSVNMTVYFGRRLEL